MGKLRPFFSEAEQKEIRRVGRLFFAGVDPYEEKELIPVWQKWQFFFELFLMVCDRRNGNLLHLPFGGNPLSQPYKGYKVIQYIQSLYFEHIKEEYEKLNR